MLLIYEHFVKNLQTKVLNLYLLVKKENLQKAQQALKAAGYDVV